MYKREREKRATQQVTISLWREKKEGDVEWKGNEKEGMKKG